MNEKSIKLEQTKKVFDAINGIIETGSCSYRYLIYDLLGFEPEDYSDLISGMNITNYFVEQNDVPLENCKLKQANKLLNEECDIKEEQIRKQANKINLIKKKIINETYCRENDGKRTLYFEEGQIDELLEILNS